MSQVTTTYIREEKLITNTNATFTKTQNNINIKPEVSYIIIENKILNHMQSILNNFKYHSNLIKVIK